MPITGMYGPDDFANRPQGQPITFPRAAPPGPTWPMPSLEWTAGGRTRHCAAL
ncbi:hypothetical protein ABIA45_003611 [Bradyrhizobium sp. USDA 336]